MFSVLLYVVVLLRRPNVTGHVAQSTAVST